MLANFDSESSRRIATIGPIRLLWSALAALFALGVEPALATRLQPELLSKRVVSANFVGIVVSDATEVIEVDGFRIHAWRFRVENSLKGEVPLALGVAGGGWERAPTCCDPGGRYLLFAERGYRVFDRGRPASAPPIGEQDVVSPVNGKFGVLKIVDGRVEWPATIGTQPDADGRIALDLALELLRREIATSLPSNTLLDAIESKVQLPEGAHRLHDYTRVYAADGAAGTIVGFYFRDVDRRESRRIWEMPRIFDGGCDYVRFEYALAERRFYWIACNEGKAEEQSSLQEEETPGHPPDR